MKRVVVVNGWVHLWVLFCLFGWMALALLWLGGCMYISEGGGEPEPPAKVTFVDVGQGLAVLWEYDGRFALYDSGPDSAGLADTLRARGVDTLQWAVVSHGHRDHGGGLMEALAVRASGNCAGPVVRRLYVSPDTARSFVGDSLLRLAARLKVPVDTLRRGDEIFLRGRDQEGAGAGVRFKVLWPPEYIAVGENGASLVLQGALTENASAENAWARRGGAGQVLLAGDLDSAGERRLLELSPTLTAELLQVPHHGSAGSSTLRFLSQVSPRYAAIGVGGGNSYGHPTQEVLQKLRYVIGDSAAVFRTDLHGSVEFEVAPGVGVVLP